MTQLIYLFKNKFKMSQICVKWFKNIIMLIMELLNGLIQVKFMLSRLTQKWLIYYTSYVGWHECDLNPFILNPNLWKACWRIV